jgi:hypothetical protein
MMALLQRTIVATAMLTALLAGCSAGPIGDTLPQSLGGLPENAPARPHVTSRQYPGVHDMPAPRATQPLSEEDQFKLEKDLQALRDRQNAAAKDDPAPVPVPAAKPGAKKQGDAKKSDTKTSDAKTSGAKTSGAKPNP